MESKIIIDKEGNLKKVTFDELYKESNYTLRYFYRKFYNTPIEKEELYSLIDLGFYQCWKLYDHKQGGKFPTFLYSCLSKYCINIYRNKTTKTANMNREALSLEYELKADGEDGNTLADLFIQEDYEDFINQIDYKEKLRRLVKVLNETESRIVYYILKGYTVKEASDFIGFSSQRCQQVWSNAKSKMYLACDLIYDMEVL